MTNRPNTGTPYALPASAVRISAVGYFIAFLLGLPGVFLMLSPSHTAFLLEDLAAGGITDSSSLSTWRFIFGAVNLVACICPGIMSSGLIVTLKGSPVKGLGLISSMAHTLLWGTLVAGCLAAVIFVIRFTVFLIAAFRSANGVVLIYSMLISEALMVSQAIFLFFLLRKFLNRSIDTTASIAYTLATGKPDSRAIPGFPATGLVLLAVVNIVLALNRIFTVTIVYSTLRSYYSLLVATHPALYLEAACFLAGAVSNLFLARYLRRYKQAAEQLLFQSRFPSGK